MPVGKEELAYKRKKIRTYSKRLVIGLSILLGLAYLATSWFDTPDFSLYFVIFGTLLNLALFALSSWSLNDHLHKQDMNKKVGIENTRSLDERKKLIRISLDMTSSISSSLGGIISLVGSIASLSLRDHSIIFAISTLFFALGYTIMAVNIVWSCSSYLDNKFCKKDLESEPQQDCDVAKPDEGGHFCNLITGFRESSESRAI